MHVARLGAAFKVWEFEGALGLGAQVVWAVGRFGSRSGA